MAGKREFFISAAPYREEKPKAVIRAKDTRAPYVRAAETDPTSPSARFYNVGKTVIEEAPMYAVLGGLPGLTKTTKTGHGMLRGLKDPNIRAYRDAVFDARDAASLRQSAVETFRDAWSDRGVYARMGYSDAERLAVMRDAQAARSNAIRYADSAFERMDAAEAAWKTASAKWDRTIWPTVGRGLESAGSWVAGKVRSVPGYAGHKLKVAGELIAEPFTTVYRAVVPGERVVAESLWKTKVVPRLVAHKKGLAFSSALAGIIGVGTAIYKMTGDSNTKARTATVSEGQKQVDKSWNLATNDTLRASVSDSAALKTYVRGIQAAMRNEIRWDPSRTEEAELRARAAIDAVSGTPLWDQTEQASADEYVVRANDVNNYDAEYKARFADKASRLLGEDFGFKGVLK